MATAKKQAKEASPAFQGMTPPEIKDDEALKRYPTLMAYLLPIVREGVTTRPSATLTIVLRGSVYKVTLRCPGEGYETSWLTDTIVDLFKRLEAFLSSGKVLWEDTYAKKKALDKLVDGE